MIFHQIDNSIGNNIYNAYVYQDFNCYLHFHKGYEFVYVLKGELCVTVDRKKYFPKQGECMLIFPYQFHSYQKSESSKICIVVFSNAHVPFFHNLTENRLAVNPVFSLSETTEKFVLSSLIGNTLIEGEQVKIPAPDPLVLKAALYALCAEFFQLSEFLSAPSLHNDHVLDCLLYIESHFAENVSLQDMAKELGFNAEYLSRLLNRTLGIGFKTLINQYRCERAQYLLTNTNASATVAAMESGFQSIRSFNRVFKEMTGISPHELKKY